MLQEALDDLGVMRAGRQDLAVGERVRVAALHLYRGRIAALGHQPEPAPQVAEAPRRHADRDFFHVAAGDDAVLGKERRHAGTDAAELGQRHRRQPGFGLVRMDQRDAARLVLLRRPFRRSLVAGQAHRAGQAGGPLHCVADEGGNGLGPVAVVGLAGGEVEEGLVHREHLHLGRDLGKRRHDACRDLGIARRPRHHAETVRAALARFLPARAGADAEGACLVGGGNEGAALFAIDHADRLAAQPRVVELLHGGEEGIHVDQRDHAPPGAGGVICTVHKSSILA